jgi:hypothetical protein
MAFPFTDPRPRRLKKQEPRKRFTTPQFADDEDLDDASVEWCFLYGTIV